MGDHRASIKIAFSMHGVEKELDAWWNYHPSDDIDEYRIDRRLAEWLTEAYDEAMRAYFDAMDKEKDRRKAEEKVAYEAAHKAEIEAAERSELERLRAKYGTSR